MSSSSCWRVGTASGSRSRRDEERTDAQERATGNLFSILPSSGQLIIIRCGERGYYPSEWDTGNREENREIASSHNVRRGITDIQEAAMLAGSMFGWNTPGANPQWYLDNARYVNSNIVQGHIKDPIMSVYYPVSSFLLRYEIMGKQHFYLPVDKLPQELMSQRSQFIMLPDLVRGVPVMPVTATFAQNGSCTIQLEHGSYVVGEMVNQEYHITARVRVGSAEFVMGECEKPLPPLSHGSATAKTAGTAHPISFGGITALTVLPASRISVNGPEMSTKAERLYSATRTPAHRAEERTR